MLENLGNYERWYKNVGALELMIPEDISEIENLIENGLVTKRKHPNMDIWICNYTPSMQYKNAWTPVGERCRGLIVDADWNVVSRSFNKFWNLGERITISNLPDELPKIYTKEDGFLGILYSENGQPAMATRGTFDSPMAIWATGWIRSKGYTMSDFLPGFSYIFEIINLVLCREHGMVVDYGDRSECVLLAVIETATGLELNHIAEAKEIGLPFAEEFDGTLEDAINEMPTMRGKEQEGYVCRYSNGLRIKLKADEYKRIHRTLKGLSPKRILNVLIESGDEGLEKILVDVPDETYRNVKSIIEKIRNEQNRIIGEARMIYDDIKNLPTRREQAITMNDSPYKSIVFSMLDNRDYKMDALKRVHKTLKYLIDDNRKTYKQ